MHPTIIPVWNMLGRNTELILKALDGISKEHEFARPAPTANSINWIAGHITLYRYMILSVMGERVEQPWEALYARGVKADDALEYPLLSEIVARFTPTTEMIGRVKETLTEEQWAAKPLRELPGFEPNVRGTTAFLVRHESYHLGQLGYIRRLFGYDQLVG